MKQPQGDGDGNITENSKVSLTIMWTLIVGVIIVCAFLFTIKADISSSHSDTAMQIAALKQDASDRYETKSDHSADMKGLQEWNVKIAASIQGLSTKFDDYHYQTGLDIQAVKNAVDNLKLSSGTTTTTTTHQ